MNEPIDHFRGVTKFRIFPEGFHFEITLDEKRRVHTNWIGLNEYVKYQGNKEFSWTERAFQELRQLLEKRYGFLGWIPLVDMQTNGHIFVKARSRKPLPRTVLPSSENYNLRLTDNSRLQRDQSSDRVIDI